MCTIHAVTVDLSVRVVGDGMDSLAQYGSSASSSEDEDEPVAKSRKRDHSPAPHEPAPPLRSPLPLPPLSPLPPQQLTDECAALPPPPLADACEASQPCPVRQFDHVDGNFATHLYFRILPEPAFQRAIGRSVALLQAGAGSSAVHAMDAAEYHVSLSRTVALRQPQIQGFLEAVRKALRPCTCVRATTAAGVHELANDTRTRFFGAIEIERRSAARAALCTVIDAVDAVLARYDFERFYTERRLHFSVAWSLAPLLETPPAARAALAGFGLLCDAVECRVGERVTVIKLGPAR